MILILNQGELMLGEYIRELDYCSGTKDPIEIKLGKLIIPVDRNITRSLSKEEEAKILMLENEINFLEKQLDDFKSSIWKGLVLNNEIRR